MRCRGVVFEWRLFQFILSTAARLFCFLSLFLSNELEHKAKIVESMSNLCTLKSMERHLKQQLQMNLLFFCYSLFIFFSFRLCLLQYVTLSSLSYIHLVYYRHIQEEITSIKSAIAFHIAPIWIVCTSALCLSMKEAQLIQNIFI